MRHLETQSGQLSFQVVTHVAESRGWDFFGAAYFGPESGQMKGQNPAVSEAMEGGANVAKKTCRPLLGAEELILDQSD